MNALKVIRATSEIATMTNEEIQFLANALVELTNNTVADKLQFQINVAIHEKALEKEFA